MQLRPLPASLRLAALPLLLLVGVSIRAAPPFPILLAAAADYPTCPRASIGQPCPGSRASECLDMGADREPRCVSRCSSDGDCKAEQKCQQLGKDGPRRCVPKSFTPPPSGC